MNIMSFITGFVNVIQVIAAIALIILMAMQTTKSEGLSGTIGGKTESAFSKPGREEQLELVTKYAAIAFLVLSAIFAYLPH